MATNLGTGYVTVKPSMSDFSSELASGFGTAGTSCASTFAAKFGAVSGLVSATISTVCETITSSLSSAISRVDTLNQFPKVMQNLGYAAEDAEAAMSKLSDGIQGLPTTLDEIVGYTQSLVSTVGDLDTASDLAIAMNDAMIAFGASTSGASTAITQLNQMISSGTYDQQSWLSINSAAPGLLDTIAKAMLGETASMSDLRTALNDGTITTEEFIQGLISLDQDGTDSLTAFSETAQSASGGIATSMQNVGTAVTTQLANVIDAINGDGGRITGFFDDMKQIVKDVGGAVTEFVEDAVAYLEELWAAVEGSDAFAQLQAIASDVATALGDAADGFGEFIESLVPPPEDVVEGLQKVVDAFQWIHDNADSISTALVGIGTAFATWKVVTTVSSGLSSVSAVLQTVGTAASLSGGSLNTFAYYLSRTTTGGAGVTGILSTVSTGLFNLTSNVALAGGGFGGLISTITAGINPVAAIAAAVAAVAAGLIYFFTCTETGQQIWASFVEAISGAWESIQLIFETIMPLIQQAFSEWLQGVYEFWAGIWQGICDFVLGVWDGITSAVSGALETVSTVITCAIGSIKSAWSSAWSSVSSAFSSVWSGINSAAATAIKTLITAVSGIKSSVTSVFSGASSWLSSAGANIIKGLVSSIKSGISSVTSAIKSVCTSAISAAKSALGIASPSKVFAEVGAFTMEGMAEGIEGTAGTVQDALDSTVAGLSVSPEITQTAAISYDDGGHGEPLTAADVAAALIDALENSGLGVYLDGSALVGEIAPGISGELGRMTALGVC